VRGNSNCLRRRRKQNGLRFAAFNDSRSLFSAMQRLAHLVSRGVSLFAILRHRLRKHMVQPRRDR
jgi:hypothetical protein